MDLQELLTQILEQNKLILAGQAQINERLDKIESRLDGLETRMNGLETQMNALVFKIDYLIASDRILL